MRVDSGLGRRRIPGSELEETACEPAELLELAKEPLDEIALPAGGAVKRPMRLPAGLRGNDGGCAGLPDQLQDGVGVAGPVADHRLVPPKAGEKRLGLRSRSPGPGSGTSSSPSRFRRGRDGPWSSARHGRPDLRRCAAPGRAGAVPVNAHRGRIHQAQANRAGRAVVVPRSSPASP